MKSGLEIYDSAGSKYSEEQIERISKEIEIRLDDPRAHFETLIRKTKQVPNLSKNGDLDPQASKPDEYVESDIQLAWTIYQHARAII